MSGWLENEALFKEEDEEDESDEDYVPKDEGEPENSAESSSGEDGDADAEADADADTDDKFNKDAKPTNVQTTIVNDPLDIYSSPHPFSIVPYELQYPVETKARVRQPQGSLSYTHIISEDISEVQKSLDDQEEHLEEYLARMKENRKARKEQRAQGDMGELGALRAKVKEQTAVLNSKVAILQEVVDKIKGDAKRIHKREHDAQLATSRKRQKMQPSPLDKLSIYNVASWLETAAQKKQMEDIQSHQVYQQPPNDYMQNG